MDFTLDVTKPKEQTRKESLDLKTQFMQDFPQEGIQNPFGKDQLREDYFQLKPQFHFGDSQYKTKPEVDICKNWALLTGLEESTNFVTSFKKDFNENHQTLDVSKCSPELDTVLGAIDNNDNDCDEVMSDKGRPSPDSDLDCSEVTVKSSTQPKE